MNINLLIKYITGEQLTSKERKELLAWINLSEENKAEYMELKNAWVLSSIAKANIQILAKQKSKKTIMMNPLLRYAAILLIAFLTGAMSLYLLSNENVEIKYTTIEVPTGERSILSLPDGTKIWLSAETKITYATNFSSTDRKVSLEGEAFFEVTKDPKHPFSIASEYGTIEVLGTAFNLKTHKDIPFETTLIEGVVSFTSKDKQYCVLKANQKLTLEHGKLVVAEIKPVKGDVWKTDGFYFDNEDFETIAKRLEKQYGVHVELDENLNDVRFSGQIHKTSLHEVLRIINKTHPIAYQFNANNTRVEIKQL